MKKSILSLFVFLILSIGCISVAYAETHTEKIENLIKKEAYFEVYGNKLDAPTSVTEAGTETVNGFNNSLNFSATDLTLPGKNGFDFSIKRDFDTLTAGEGSTVYLDMQSIYYLKWADNYARNTTRNIITKYYLDNDRSQPYYILFKSITEMKQFEETPGVIKVGDLNTEKRLFLRENIDDWVSSHRNQEAYASKEVQEFEYFYRINDIVTRENSYTLYRDMEKSPVTVTCKSTNTYYTAADEGPGTIHLGGGWNIKLPSLKYSNEYAEDLYKTFYYKFYDPETGLTVRYSMEYKKDNTTKRYTDFRNAYLETVGTAGYHDQTKMYRIVSNLSPGLPYEERPGCCIERYDGVKFYFSAQGGLLKKEDRFGNLITYNYASGTENPSSQAIPASITDSYGRTISIEREESNACIKVDGVPMVTYQFYETNDASIDPEAIQRDDNQLTLSVQKGEAGAAGSTIRYNMTPLQCKWYLTQFDLLYRGSTNIYHAAITSIELATGASINYEYKIQKDKWRQGDELGKEYPRLSARWETTPDQPNEKQNYSTYNWEKKSPNYVSQNVDENVEKEEVYNNKCQRIKTVYTYSDGKKIVQDYTYSDGNPEGVSLISQLVETTTISGKSNTKTTNKTYNKYHQPLTINESGRQTKITYNDYGLPIEQKQKQSDGVYVGTKNTYSEDGKKVIKTESFKQTGETYEYFETTDFEYNQYGEVTKTTAHNEPQANAVTDIAYNYAPEEEGILYTKTTTVNDVEHVDNRTNISILEKYDHYGNRVYNTCPKGCITTTTFDKLGRPLIQTNPDQTTRQFSYDSIQNEIILTNENGINQKIKFDKLGREQAIYMNEPGVGYHKIKQTDYDLFNRPIKISLFADSETTPSSVMEYTYYADSSPKSETAKEGSKVLSKKDYAYAISNSLNQTTVEVYSDNTAKTQIVQSMDLFNSLKEQRVSFNGKIYTQTFTHDTLGNVLTTTDFRANDENYTNKEVIKNTYDHANRVMKQEVQKDDGTYMESSTVYDKLGRVVSFTDFNGNTKTIKYNKVDKEIEIITPVENNVVSK